MDGDAHPAAGRNGTCLLVATGARISPDTLETAIHRAHAAWGRIDVLIPLVLPPTLPISATPSRLAGRLDVLRRRAVATLTRIGADGRVEVVRARDVGAALRAAATRRPDAVMLAGSAGWRLRRAAHGIAPVSVVSDRAPRPRRPDLGPRAERPAVTEL